MIRKWGLILGFALILVGASRLLAKNAHPPNIVLGRGAINLSER